MALTPLDYAQLEYDKRNPDILLRAQQQDPAAVKERNAAIQQFIAGNYGEYAQPAAAPAETDPNKIFYDSSQPFSVTSQDPIVGNASLISSGQYRDIPQNVINDYLAGRISQAQARSLITNTPIFNPNIGPQINTGAGPTPLTSDQQQQLTQGTPLNQVVNQANPQLQQIAQQPTSQTVQQPGQTISQPVPQVGGAQPPAQTYRVQAGDTLSAIAQRYGVPVSAISGYRSGNPNLIYPGEMLTIAGQQPAQPVQPRQSATQSMQLTPQSSDGGISSQIGLPSELSATTIEDVIKKVSAAFGLTDVSDELKKVEDAKAEEIREANENPWISEGLRVRKLNAISQKYESKKNALVERLRLQQDVVGKAIDVYYKERALKQELLFKQYDLYAKTLTEPKTTDDIREYEYAKSQGFTGTMMDYFKQKSAKDGVTGELTSRQQAALTSVTTRFQADAVMQQAANGVTISSLADSVIANPDDPTKQLASLYLLVKNLDPTSAVREGELALANSTQSYLQQFGNSLTRISEGIVLSPDAAVQLAEATKEIASLWSIAAQRRESQYRSQANVLGIGDEFGQYLSGFSPTYKSDQGGVDSIVGDLEDDIATLGGLYQTREMLIQALTETYPELSESEIAGKVYTLIPDK